MANANGGDTSNAGQGGAGDQNGNGAGAGDGGGAPLFSEAQIAAIGELITKSVGQVVNAAITNHMKRIPKAPTLEELVPQLEERFKPILSQQGQGAGGGAGAQKAPEIVQLEKTLSSLQKELQTERDNRLKLEQQRKEEGERSLLSKTLEAAGITATQQRAAIAFLRSEGKVRATDEGQLIFVDEDGSEAELGKGISKWITTAEGKVFLPATGAQGAGTQNSGRQRNAPPPAKNESEERQQLIHQHFFGGAG